MTDNNNDKPGSPERSLTYADAGVDIAAGNALVNAIKPLVSQTDRDGVIGTVGGFGGLFEIPVERYSRPVMVSGTDGVGTKLRLAMDMGVHKTIGIDLVAMCVNDIIVSGAEPLWFLDYYATGKLDVSQTTDVIAGISEGCRQSGMALLGGETAEMPGMYSGSDYDLAGFAVGIVEKNRIIDGTRVSPGNAIIGVASSGAHSNGYSLIRRLLEDQDLNTPFGETTLGHALLAPTKIYAKPVGELLSRALIKGMAHITGGGLTENLPRSLPKGTTAEVDVRAWKLPELFQWIRNQGNINMAEMLRTFNCGIGMALIVDQADTAEVLQVLADWGETAFVIGTIKRSTAAPGVIYSNSD